MAKAKTSASNKRVDARPEKRFFIDMLIRDIELIPAITDLVDNSVDGAIALSPKRKFDGLEVSLEVTEDAFGISDTCGGIPLKVATEYAFRFGRPLAFTGVPGSVGQFGVGMKRALFKLGSHFRIESQTKESRFLLIIDVEKWAQDDDPNWSFQMQEAEENSPPSKDSPLGTRIKVDKLHPSVSEDFGLSQTIAALRVDLQLRHQRALASGMKIALNNEALKASKPALLKSTAFSPIHRKLKLNTNGSQVNLDLYAGLARSGDGKREAEAETILAPGEAGWYLFCNDRLVFAADKTALTGWGRGGGAAYHPQYRDFRGYAFLTAKDAGLLPWNTTKTGVDQDSPVFRQVKAQMQSSLKGVQAVVNRLKKETEGGQPEEKSPLAQSINEADEVSLEDIPVAPQVKVPGPPSSPPPKTQQIVYSVLRAELERAKEELGSSTASEVGRETFRYFYEREVGDT